MAEQHHSKVLIIGAGPAGYTAAIYAARANLQPMLVTGMQPGGQLTITTDVENYPGFADIIQGPWLMEQMQKQAEHVGTRIILDMINALDLARRPFVATGDSGDLYVGETVIIATGAQARWLGVPSEAAFRGFGVSACATCDGFFFRDKEVVVVGGGNTAVEEAIYLTNHARRVTLIHRRDALRAEKILQDRLFRNPKIDIVWDSVVEEIVGDRRAARGHRGQAAQRAHRRRHRARLRRRLRRDRPHAGDRAGRRPAAARRRGLYPDRARFDRDRDPRGFRRRRRQGQGVPPGGDGRRAGLHGRARGGEVSRRAGGCRGGARRRIARRRGATGRTSAEGKNMAMDWDKLRVFHAVAEAGSFTHAGEALNLSQSAVSRQISALEESLSVPLFHRHARGLILTEQGELLFRTAREVFAKLAMSESLISESKDRPKGPLKITTTVAFGSIWLTPRIREFLDLYPEIQVSLVVDDSELDLSMREADVAIRMSPPRQPDLIQRHLVSVQVHIYAAPEYLKKHGTPQRPEDLDEHRLIVYGEDARPPVAGRELAARCRRQARARPPADPERQQHLWHAARRQERAGPRRAARFRRGRARRAGARAAGDRRAAERGLFRLSGGAALVEADQRVPRFPAAQGGRGPARLNRASCRGLRLREFRSLADSIAVFADEPERIPDW